MTASTFMMANSNYNVTYFKIIEQEMVANKIIFLFKGNLKQLTMLTVHRSELNVMSPTMYQALS